MTVNELWAQLLKCSKEIGSFPRIRTFADYVNLKPEIVAKVYRRWYSENKLIRNGNYYDFPNSVISIKTEKKNIIEKVKDEGFSKLSAKEKDSFKVILIRCLVGFIGFVLIACSVHFTFEFNKLGMSKLWAFLLSFSTVTFMSFAFTIASYMTNKSSSRMIKILWFVGITYSVFTAVSGQFNDFRSYSASDNSMVNQQKIKLLEKQIKDIDLEVKSIEKEKTPYQRLVNDLAQSPEKKFEYNNTWKDANANLQRCNSRINELKEKKTNCQTELFNIMGEGSADVENETVYNWLAKIFHIPANFIQFLVILFPSLFIDLCSTVSITFALGKQDR